MATDGSPRHHGPEPGGSRPRIEEIEGRLLEFIRRELLSPGTDVGREDDLLSGDLLDSVAVLRLAAFVEDELRAAVRPADFVIENFRNVAVLAEYVAGAAGSGG